MSDLLIKNASIVNEGQKFKGYVLIKDQKIVLVREGSANFDASNVIDAEGLLLMPGVIDDQVHFREPGLTHKGTIYSESRAAAAGGITSYMEMPNTIPKTITQQALKEKFEIAEKDSLVNFSFYIGATNDNLEELLKTDPQKVCGVKLFMGSSTGNMLVDNKESLRNIFANIQLPLAVHCEDEGIIKTNIDKYSAEYGDDIPFSCHPLIRSAEACYKSSSQAVELALKYGTHLHVIHLSTAKELELFKTGGDLRSKQITNEVCIHHLWFNENDYKKYGAFIKWNPAIKTAKDQAALLEAVRNDKIDIIATDHSPHTLLEKQNSYLKAPSGGPLVQHSLVVMLELCHDGKISLEKIVEKMCHSPADVFHVSKRGFLREGYWADLVLVDLKSKWKVEKSNLFYKCGWSPFEGTEFHSKIHTTIVNGSVVYSNEVFAEGKSGMALSFER
jgi:dihydroorotase